MGRNRRGGEGGNGMERDGIARDGTGRDKIERDGTRWSGCEALCPVYIMAPLAFSLWHSCFCVFVMYICSR